MNVLSVLVLAALSLPVAAGPHTFFGGIGGNATVKVTSYQEAKYRSVVKQQYDFSCGSAVLATLLTYHYGIPTTEKDTFDAMYRAGDREKIQKKGFSLLDMKRYLARRGLRSDGFRIPLSKVARLGVPVIVLINTGGYKHFVVVKGIQDGTVLVGDPAKGLTKIPARRFEAMSAGIVFLIRDEARAARASFNNKADWGVVPQAPLRAAARQTGISDFSLMLPIGSEF